jgi:hypothetical protein
MRLPHAVLAAAALLLSVPAAQALTIDDFSVDQAGFIAPGGGPTVFQGGVPAGLGGSRELMLSRFSGAGSLEFTSDSGLGNFGFGPNVAGQSSLTYDGTLDGLIDDDGLGADLTDGGSSTLLRIVLRSDVAGPLSIEILSAGGNTSLAAIVTPGLGLTAGFTTVLIPFASFAVTGGAGADFADVGAIRVTATSTNIGHDLQIDRIDTVPEPTTAALLGLGLALTASVSRRRAG